MLRTGLDDMDQKGYLGIFRPNDDTQYIFQCFLPSGLHAQLRVKATSEMSKGFIKTDCDQN